MRRVLVLETDDTLRRDLLLGLRQRGIDAESIEGMDAAGAILRGGQVDIVLLGMQAGSVPELVRVVSESSVPVQIVALVDGDPSQGLAAIRQGASDFVALSDGVEGVALAFRKIEARRLARGQDDGGLPRRPSGSIPGSPGVPAGTPLDPAPATPRSAAAGSQAGSTAGPAVLVGESPRLAEVMEMVRRLAGVRTGVLVGGESGTGKELVARALHDQSPWREGPFVAVNCGAIPSGLIESELFGHMRGSFTDAVRDKPGLFEAAHGGTLFLDEIADLPVGSQSKLLRAVQDGVIRRVGDVSDQRVEVRVVAATARDLAAEVQAGRFREDLYYRLGLRILLPSLRERREDVSLLALHFLRRARARFGVAVDDIDSEAMRLLCSYSWPGNIRELENTIERAAVLCVGRRIDVASLPEQLVASVAPRQRADQDSTSPGNGAAPSQIVTDLSIKRASRKSEEDLIRRALAVTAGNRTHAAGLLQISHRALLYKIKEYGIVVRRGRIAHAGTRPDIE
jgi:two-component system response regulator AtoC